MRKPKEIKRKGPGMFASLKEGFQNDVTREGVALTYADFVSPSLSSAGTMNKFIG